MDHLSLYAVQQDDPTAGVIRRTLLKGDKGAFRRTKTNAPFDELARQIKNSKVKANFILIIDKAAEEAQSREKKKRR